MTSISLRGSTVVLLSLATTSPVLAVGQPVDLYWADRWNAAYHRFTDGNQNGSFNDPGEVAYYIDRDDPASFPASALEVFTDPWDISVRPRRVETSPADLDGDGQVGFTDLTLLLGAWGTPDADLDGDGTTGFTDLTTLLGAWGP